MLTSAYFLLSISPGLQPTEHVDPSHIQHAQWVVELSNEKDYPKMTVIEVLFHSVCGVMGPSPPTRSSIASATITYETETGPWRRLPSHVCHFT